MGWKIYLWAMAALVLLPLPFKLADYASGKDASPRRVKIEEMANAAFFLVGLVGLYGFAYGLTLVGPDFWIGWVIVAVLVSVGALWWSPKVEYAASVMGKTRTRAVMAVGSLAFLPMLYGLLQYAARWR